MVLLAVGATLLLFVQMMLGTSVYFAGAVYVSLLVTIGTLGTIGFGSVAGVLISYFVLRYLVVAEVAKSLYGQPGDTNLGAPESTITVILLGISVMCLAAILVSYYIGKRRMIAIEPSEPVLFHIRNFSIVLGMACQIVVLLWGESQGTTNVGGVFGIARQFTGILDLAILTETLRTLMHTAGRRSVSRVLLLIVGYMMVVAVIANTKKGLADPLVMYLLTAIAYRGFVTRQQMMTVVAAMVGGVMIAYPAVQILRGTRAGGTVSLSTAGQLIGDAIADPSTLSDAWSDYRINAELNRSLYGYAIDYLGTYDDLLGRFLLIVNTDVLITAVDQDEPYGPELITIAFEQLLPTFIAPDKPRDDLGDLLTWHYGLRLWGVTGYPTIGYFVDSYAALGYNGVVFITFILSVIFFAQIQLAGTAISQNFLGVYFTFKYLHAFGENPASGMLCEVLRNIPLEYVVLFSMFYVADVLVFRRQVPSVGGQPSHPTGSPS